MSSPAVSGQPCPWPLPPNVCPDVPDRDSLIDEDDDAVLYDFLLAAATEILWRASGRRYGLCSATVRPCSPGCAQLPTYLRSRGLYQALGGSLPFFPILLNGAWSNCSSCGDCGACRCCTAGCHEVDLPAPVYSVENVTVDGEELSSDLYRLDSNRLLVRTDGVCWPRCQDFALPDGAVGTWSVTFTHGLPVTPLGQLALGVLFCEMWKGANGNDCALPLNTDGIFRQGVNIDFADKNLDLLSDARTGLPEVDRFLASVNPHKLHEPSSVFSPDLPRGRMTTWPTS